MFLKFQMSKSAGKQLEAPTSVNSNECKILNALSGVAYWEMPAIFGPLVGLLGLSAVTHFESHRPPALFPGAHAACGPDLRIIAHGLQYAARHRPQGIADEIGSRAEDGELGAVLEERVGHGAILFAALFFFIRT